MIAEYAHVASGGNIVDSMDDVAEIYRDAARQVWRHALDTFGTEARAIRWMRIPLAELGHRTPEDVLLGEPQNPAAVEAILTRIDYGVYA
jgi:putative toxin-antitoxin system antitoxin component (TIGR02293 family)